MTTTGTSTFNLEIADVIEEAAMRAGGQPMLGNEVVGAIRLLDLMLTDWQNRGILLWTLEYDSLALVKGTSLYTLPVDTVDIYAAALHRGNFDFMMPRLSAEKWLAIPNKTTQGRPTQYFVERLRDGPQIHLWLVPENSTDTVSYWRIRNLQDSNKLAINPDVPRRYLPPLVSGLAYYFAQRRPASAEAAGQGSAYMSGAYVAMQRITQLKGLYEEELQRAMEEDRERAPSEAKPRFRI